MIPSRDEWPESSLAYMLHELCDALPVSQIQSLEGSINPSKPCWIFGTSLQLMDLIQGPSFPLHPDSLVFETGGSKGQKVHISRDEIYEAIASFFQICPNRIVSEYGMAELSSQAYDWVEPGRAPQPLTSRWFQFPHWVELSVSSDIQNFRRYGKGCLTVYDPLRVDLPYPLRTQDMVDLHPDGKFQLLGRAPHSILKGCSLNWESDHKGCGSLPKKPTAWLSLPDQETLFEKGRKLHRYLDDFLPSREAKALLQKELFHPTLAAWAQDGINRCRPDLPEGWVKIAQQAQVDGRVPKRWLHILPSNHGMAGLEVVLAGAMLGVSSTYRIPDHLKGSLIERLIHDLGDLGLHSTEVVGSTFRLTEAMQDFDSIRVFGHDSTIHHIQQVTGVKVRGHGHQLTIATLTPEEVLEHPIELLKEAFSLGQKGCYCVRALILKGSFNDSSQVQEALNHTMKSIALEPSNQSLHIALAHEMIRFQFFDALPKDYEVKAGLFPLTRDVGKGLSSVPFVLPILAVEDDAELLHCLNHLAPTRIVTKSLSMPAHYEDLARNLGTYGWEPWTGVVDGQPLFS